MIERFLKILFLWIALPGAIIWFTYRAVWTLAALFVTNNEYKQGRKLTQNNIKVWTQWGTGGTAAQSDEFLNGSGSSGGFSFELGTWIKGLFYFFLIPFILLSPAFYGGLFWEKETEQILD